MAEGDKDAKTEAATPARLFKAIDHGEMPMARELPGALSLLAIIGVLTGLGPELINQHTLALAHIIAGAGAPGGFHHALRVIGAASLSHLAHYRSYRRHCHCGGHHRHNGPVRFSSALASAAPTFRHAVTDGRFGPIIEHNHLIDTLRSTVKLVIVGVAVALFVKARLPALIGTIGTHPSGIALWVGKTLLAVASAAALGNLMIAGADLAWTRFRFQSQIKMTHTKIRDESRETDGNPEIKARLRGPNKRSALLSPASAWSLPIPPIAPSPSKPKCQPNISKSSRKSLPIYGVWPNGCGLR
jgi:flagellar biosynthetic protein FlhB